MATVLPVDAAERVKEWAKHALAEVREARQRASEARNALEVDIESHPLEPQLSAQLNGLMKQEEAAGRAGKQERKRRLAQKIEAQMRQECESALQYIIDLHGKRRTQLARVQVTDRAAFLKRQCEQVEAVQRHVGISVSSHPLAELLSLSGTSRKAGRRGKDRKYGGLPAVTTPSPSSGFPAGAAFGAARPRSSSRGRSEDQLGDGSGGIASDFSAEEAKMRKAVDEYWAESERFNLKQAFSSQAERIDVEWSSYLAEMELQYKQARSKITNEAISPAKVGSAKGSGAWVDKEKQATLIHTAPVLAPTAAGGFGTAGAGSRPRGGGSTKLSATSRKELADLERRFEDAKWQVAIQREEAVRWARRQSDRMLMQVDATEVERKQRRAIEAKEEESWNRVQEAIHSTAAALLRTPVSATPGAGKAGRRSSRPRLDPSPVVTSEARSQGGHPRSGAAVSRTPDRLGVMLGRTGSRKGDRDRPRTSSAAPRHYGSKPRGRDQDARRSQRSSSPYRDGYGGSYGHSERGKRSGKRMESASTPNLAGATGGWTGSRGRSPLRSNKSDKRLPRGRGSAGGKGGYSSMARGW